ncbi:MAG TPA: autotransporter-associated beta strand repeat-containing protein [Verrucomicrobiae bacterium]
MKNHLIARLLGRYCSWSIVCGCLSWYAQADTFLWNAATFGPNNWNVNANWTPDTGNPGIDDTAVFGELGVGFDQYTVNNVVSVSTTISALNYTNITGTTWHVTQIPAGTLTVTGPVLIGGQTGGGYNTSAAMTGGGTFLVTGTTNLLTLGNTTGSGSATPGTLDLSALTNFVFNATNGIIRVGGLPTGTGSRSTGVLTLAANSNNITTATLDMNGATGTSSQPAFNLGAGTNIINANTFNVGGGRSTTKFQFYDFIYGGLRLRGTGGTDADRCTMVVGNRNTGGTGTFNTSGSVLMNGHPVDMKFATLTLGLMSRSQSGSDAGKYQPQGIFEFDQGIVDATTVNMGVCSGNSTNAGATGTLTVGYTGTLLVSNVSLANVSSPAVDCGGTGTLTVNGGVVDCLGSIVKTSVTGSTGIVVVVGGRLSVVGSIGSPTNALDTLSLSDSTVTLSADISASVTVTAFDTAGITNIINISSLPPIFAYPAQFKVIQYSGTIGGFGFDNNIGLGSLPVVSPAYTGYLSNNTVAGSVDLVITGGPEPSRSLAWDGTPNGDWDTTTLNWRFSGNSTFYRQNDAVLFDDTATGTTTVNLTTAMEPLSLTINNATKNYTFTGSGSLSGSFGLLKQGAGTLTIGNSGLNDFGGGVTIEGGRLQLGGSADRLPTNSAVSLADDASAVLDLNNVDQTLASVSGGGSTGGNITLGSGALSIGGAGTYGGVISGDGELIKSGTGTLTLLGANLYSGGTLINTGAVVVINGTGSGTGPGPVLIAGGTLQIGTNGTSGSIAPQASGYITNHGILRFSRSDTLTPAEIMTGNGAVRHSGSGLLIFNHDNSYTNTTTIDRNNGILRISTPNALGMLDGGTTVGGGNGTPVSAGGALELSGGVVFAPERLTLGCRGSGSVGLDWVASSQFVNHDGTNTWTGPIDITTGGIYVALQSDNGLMRIQGSIAGGPTATGPRRVVFRGAAAGEVSGVISNGPVTTALNIAVGDSGTWTLSGANLYTGSTWVTNTATLLVNGVIGGSDVTVVGGKLGGTGLINAPVTIDVNGTLAPGVSIGTLTISNTLTLAGTTEMEVSHSAADKVAGLTSVVLGGTLKVKIVGSLTGTEEFKLFEVPAGGIMGDFLYDLPTLTPPLAWDTSSVPVDGTLRVTGGVEAPEIGTINRASDGNFQLTGTGPGTGTYRIFATADIALPLTSWVQIGSGSFTGGSFTFTDLNATNYPIRFYYVVAP